MAFEKLSQGAVARIRDGAIHALDDLNRVIEDVEAQLSPEDARELRGAIGLACSGVLEHLVEPLLRAHPDCELSLEEWEGVALRHRKRV